MEFTGFFSYAAQYFFKEIQALPRPFLFAGEKNMVNISSLDLSIELNCCGGGRPTLTPNAQPVWRSCLSTSTISLEESGGKAAKNHGQLTYFFPGRNMPKKNGETKVGKTKPPKEDVQGFSSNDFGWWKCLGPVEMYDICTKIQRILWYLPYQLVKKNLPWKVPLIHYYKASQNPGSVRKNSKASKSDPTEAELFEIYGLILLMAEILHHLECMKPYK